MDGRLTLSPPATFIEVRRRQRDALWFAVKLELSVLADLPQLAEAGEAAPLEDVQQRREVALWLLDDLGHRREDPRERFLITLPHDALASWLERQRRAAAEIVEEASAGLEHPEDYLLTPQESTEDARRSLQEELDTELDLVRACDALLQAAL